MVGGRLEGAADGGGHSFPMDGWRVPQAVVGFGEPRERWAGSDSGGPLR